MIKIATIIGRTEKGELVHIGLPAENDTLKDLKNLRNKIRDAGGLVPKGFIRGAKDEIKLTEMRVLSTHTSGGELFGTCRW